MANELSERTRPLIDYLSPSARRVWWLLAGYLAAGLGALFVLSLTATDVITVRGAQFSLYGPLLDAVMFGAVVMCGWRVAKIRVERTPWILMTIALAFWLIGNVIWHVAYDGAGPLPSWADPFWLAFFLPAYGAVSFLIRERGLSSLRFSLWVDGLIVILALAALATDVAYQTLVSDFHGSALAASVVMAYPVSDLALLGAVVMVLTFTHWKPERAWYLLVLGLSLKTVTDVAFTYQASHGDYVFGGWPDFAWVVAVVALGLAAWQSTSATNTRAADNSWGLWNFVLAVVSALIALVVLSQAAGESKLAAGLAVAAMSLVLMRGLLAYLEIDRTRVDLAVSNSKLHEMSLLKDQVMSTVTHELRNPLTSVAGYTELLLDDVDGTLKPEGRSLLGRIESESAHLLHILDDLQMVNALEERGDTSLLSQPALTPVDIALVARHAVENVAASAVQQSVDVHLYTDDETILIYGDEQRLRQVLDNLLSNAIKYSPGGGDVDLRIWHEDNEIVVAMSDEGIGIAPEDQVLLFSRFFRASNAVAKEIPGTGLGLSISKAIVEQHKGTINIDSDMGVGTVVTVCLPIDQARAASRVNDLDTTRTSTRRKLAI